ncbi:MAG TPA: tripartite tricarboxylate transporter substrate-binding protein, partial [Burkholderiales bacterium]|nr:tripartite tricarboxylate transporter substrate-binding protein [Burkholderiales bacterium]
MQRMIAGATLAGVVVAGCTFTSSAAVAAFPERPVRLIVAQSPGGNADIIGRALAEGLSERLGQQVIVDNRGGASGIIAIEL